MNYKNLLLLKSKNISEAIKIIDSSDLRVCFVVNNNNKLCGSVTDGDIRRGLLKKISFDQNIYKICNKKPKYALEKEKNFKKFQSDINCIPIIDKKKKFLGLKFLKKEKIKQLKLL